MRQFLPLENTVREYAWGSRTAIAELLGRDSPASGPQAELWMGAHPDAPSRVRVDGHQLTLDELVERQPVEILGREACERFGKRLPFLLKVLAAERPLSIQAHPDARQAREGFESENRRGVALDAPERCYRDDQPKPELLCALTRFQALRGFRPPSEIRGLAEQLGIAALSQACEPLAEADEGRALRGFLAGLFDLGRESARTLVESVAGAVAGRSGEPECEWLARLASEHPADVGALAPLFLNRVELEPGRAIFLPAGELHVYLEGVAVELMGSSDNVLRGGLTAKHVDAGELLRVLRFESGPVEILDPGAGRPGERCFAAPAREFRLCVSALAAGESYASPESRSVDLVLCTEGTLALAALASDERITLSRGASCLIPAALGAYHMTGPGTAYRASVPE